MRILKISREGTDKENVCPQKEARFFFETNALCILHKNVFRGLLTETIFSDRPTPRFDSKKSFFLHGFWD